MGSSTSLEMSGDHNSAAVLQTQRLRAGERLIELACASLIAPPTCFFLGLFLKTMSEFDVSSATITSVAFTIAMVVFSFPFLALSFGPWAYLFAVFTAFPVILIAHWLRFASYSFCAALGMMTGAGFGLFLRMLLGTSGSSSFYVSADLVVLTPFAGSGLIAGLFYWWLDKRPLFRPPH